MSRTQPVNDGKQPREERLLKALLEVADRMGMDVRYEDLGDAETSVSSGSCRYKGDLLVLLDRRSENQERIRVLLRALSRLDLEGVYLPPMVRDLLCPDVEGKESSS